VIDDLVDSGATAEVVREMFPKALFATVYAKPQGKALTQTFVREFPQDCWLVFPWDQ
jgi:xanthine phosphoribosyltransferase